MTPPTVSVVVPAYNAEQVLPRLLESMAALDFPGDRLEVLVVDNRSQDKTRDVLQGFPWVRQLSETDRQGCAAARNTGVQAASGDIIACTDADCVVSPQWLSNLLGAFAEPQVGAVAGRLVALDPATPVERLSERWKVLSQERFMQARPWPVACTANLAIRRNVLQRLGGFNGAIRAGEDFEICYRMQSELSMRLVYAPEAVVSHRHRTTLCTLFEQSVRYGRSGPYLRARLPGFRVGPGLKAYIRGLWPLRLGSLDDLYEPFFLITYLGGLALGNLLGQEAQPSPGRTDPS